MPGAGLAVRACSILFGAWCLGCAYAPAQPGKGDPAVEVVRPSVLLVTFDTLRADRLVANGPMPRLRGLLPTAVAFDRAHAQVPLTLVSHATILTGVGPRRHGVRDNVGYALPKDVPTVAEALNGAGYATAAFVGGYPLDASFGLSRGFDVYDDHMTRHPGGARSGHTERRAAEVVDAAVRWFRKRADGPFFLWVHLFDPHDPYEAPRPFGETWADPYDAEVAYADREFGRLFDTVASGERAAVWTIVTADHGEDRLQHGEPTHGVLLYETTLHVPLVIRPPGGVPGRRSAAPASLADLAPTMLDAVGLAGLPDVDGRSLMPAVRGEGRGVPPGPLYLESIHGRRKYGWAVLRGFLDWPYKFVAAPTPELYRLDVDPNENENLAPATDIGPRLSLLRELSADARNAWHDVSDSELERLAALGYVGAGAGARRASALDDRRRPDPKERIAALPPLERGLSALEEGRRGDARRELENALRLDPDNLVALNNLGILTLQEGQVAAAEKLFAEGLDRDGSSAHLANNLGIARSRLGRHEAAAEAFRRALAARPDFTAARFNLALALYRLGQRDEALRQLAIVAEQEPDFPELQKTIADVRRGATD